MSEFKMPSLGADMEAGKLVEWLVKPGDAVKRGDIIAVVETQKGAIEIEVFEDGVVEERLVDLGAKLPVGAVMARIRATSEASVQPTVSSPPAALKLTIERAPAPIVRLNKSGSARVSPAARRLAQKRQVNVSAVTGTGPGGAVTYADVAAYAAAPRLEKHVGYDFSQMRRAIADAMARSKREIPHYYLSHTVDIAPAQNWVTKENVRRPPSERLLLGALFVKAVALGARAFPEFNGFYTENEFHPSAPIHVGVAISIRGGGLVAPAIHDAVNLDLATLMAKMRDLVGRVRAERFKSSEIADPTITLSSLGDRGVEGIWGVIYPPQVAIVGFGSIVMRPWVLNDAVSATPTVSISLAADHRVSDGHRGALFLERVGQLLEQPGAL